MYSYIRIHSAVTTRTLHKPRTVAAPEKAIVIIHKVLAIIIKLYYTRNNVYACNVKPQKTLSITHTMRRTRSVSIYTSRPRHCIFATSRVNRTCHPLRENAHFLKVAHAISRPISSTIGGVHITCRRVCTYSAIKYAYEYIQQNERDLIDCLARSSHLA